MPRKSKKARRKRCASCRNLFRVASDGTTGATLCHECFYSRSNAPVPIDLAHTRTPYVGGQLPPPPPIMNEPTGAYVRVPPAVIAALEPYEPLLRAGHELYKLWIAARPK